MGLTYSDLQIQKNTSAWITSGGIHVTALFPTLGTVEGHDQSPAPLYMFEGDNNANAKYLSRPTPQDGVNPGVSTWWESWVKTSDSIYFIIGNQQTLQVASASIRGYAIYFESGGAISILRLNGGGGTTVITTVATATITDLVRIRLSREVSGANRLWRVYLNDMVTPLAAAVNDATYTDFQYWGWDHLTYARMICGGESCRS